MQDYYSRIRDHEKHYETVDELDVPSIRIINVCSRAPLVASPLISQLRLARRSWSMWVHFFAHPPSPFAHQTLECPRLLTGNKSEFHSMRATYCVLVKDRFLPNEYSQSISYHLFCTRMTSSRFPVALLRPSFSPDTRYKSIPTRLTLISQRWDGNMPND